MRDIACVLVSTDKVLEGITAFVAAMEPFAEDFCICKTAIFKSSEKSSVKTGSAPAYAGCVTAGR